MKTFLQQSVNMLLRIRIQANGNMAEIDFGLEDIQYSDPAYRHLFESKKIHVPIHIIEGLIEYLKHGNPFNYPYRVEFRDVDKSYLIFFYYGEKMIFRSFNRINSRVEEFEFDDMDKMRLALVLSSALS
jgi:hypothetical protein